MVMLDSLKSYVGGQGGLVGGMTEAAFGRRERQEMKMTPSIIDSSPFLPQFWVGRSVCLLLTPSKE